MGITGIIAEYNPFHLGHAYQFSKARDFSDRIIVIMSGDVVQRGEFAILDKWKRTDLALRSGADLVMELSPVFSLSSANLFAEGAVRTLSSLGMIDDLFFGTEDDIEILNEVTDILLKKESSLDVLIKENLEQGKSYPRAQYEAFLSLYGKHYAEVLEKPNNILGIEYIKAIRRYADGITPVTLKRTSSHDSVPENGFASGLAIREMIRSKDASWKQYVPEGMDGLYEGPVFTEDCFTLLISRLRAPGALEALRDTPDVSEGIENKIVKASYEASDFDDLLKRIKSKRYPLSRIKRILLSFLIGIKRNDISDILLAKPVVRILGIRKDSTDLLSMLSSDPSVKLVTNLSGTDIPRDTELSIQASNIRGLLCNPPKRHNSDFYQRFITI